MPELPDVEGYKRVLDRHGLRRKIARASVLDRRILKDASPQALGKCLANHTLKSSERYGKVLLATIDSGGLLVMRFGMTGNLVFQDDAGDEPPKYARLLLEFGSGDGRLVYTSRRMLGSITFADDRGQFIQQQKLGPDGLSEAISAKMIGELVRKRKGAIKPLLMDQSLIAGIGNVYADEILYQARIHPGAPANSLDDEQVRDLARTIKRVLRTAADKGGDISRLPKRYLLRHRERGEECPVCGGRIETMMISGRTAYYCPTCQKGPQAG